MRAAGTPIAGQRSAKCGFWGYGLHLPLNRQRDVYQREGVDLDVSTLADWVGAAAATLMSLVEAIRRHVFAAERRLPSTRCGESSTIFQSMALW
jgi:transposase